MNGGKAKTNNKNYRCRIRNYEKRQNRENRQNSNIFLKKRLKIGKNSTQNNRGNECNRLHFQALFAYERLSNFWY